MKIFPVARILVIVGLLLALLPWPLNYYEVLRCLVLLVCLMEIWRAGKSVWTLAFIAIAIVFNPFYVWSFLRWQWSLLDVVAIGLFARGFLPVSPRVLR